MSALPVIPRERLPYFWRGMPWTQKAAWLLSARLVRDYSEACRVLASMRKPAARKYAAPSAQEYQAQLERQKLS